MLDDSNVAIYKQAVARYSETPPFHPPEVYPEYFLPTPSDCSNQVYDSIRNSLYLLKFDEDNFGTTSWNPFGHFIGPGDTVLLKPNMIAPSHENDDQWLHVTTHGSVIRAIVDYVYIALRGHGHIIIADAPQTDSDINLIRNHCGIDYLQELYWMYKKFDIKFVDLRNEYWKKMDGVYTKIVKLPGDPKGNTVIDLGMSSCFYEHYGKGKRYYGAFYDIDETNIHHNDNAHEYMISRTALDSDVFISLPKLKTHKKVGVTLNLKGLVGINGNKNWLPHYTIGSPEENGDQFLKRTLSTQLENGLVIRAKKLLLGRNSLIKVLARKSRGTAYRLFGKTCDVIRSGNWYGNDTCWRMTLDLNHLLLYGRSDGTMRETPKRYFSLVDGIIGMEGNGPVAGNPKPAGLIVAGPNPLATDLVCTYLMGFDYRKIPLLYRAFDEGAYPIAAFSPQDIYVYSNQSGIAGKLPSLSDQRQLHFEPPLGWKGHMEL